MPNGCLHTFFFRTPILHVFRTFNNFFSSYLPFLSMSRHLNEDQIRQLLAEMCESAYASLSFYCLEPTLTFPIYHATFSSALDILLEAIPDEPTPYIPSQTVATQCPELGAYAMVPLSAPFALRCSSNTISAGRRCRYQAFYPSTL